MEILEWFDVILSYVFPLFLLVLAYFVGRWLEKKHYQSILAREEALHHIMIVQMKRPPPNFINQQLVRGSVVVSSDYFTRFLAFFRQIFGGSIGSYETLLDRARREAILRMKEQASDLNANMIFNLKFETATLGNIHAPNQGGALGTVEVLVYGTAGRLNSNNN